MNRQCAFEMKGDFMEENNVVPKESESTKQNTEIGLLQEMVAESKIQTKIANKKLKWNIFGVGVLVFNLLIVSFVATWLVGTVNDISYTVTSIDITGIENMMEEISSLSSTIEQAVETLDVDSFNQIVGNLNTTISPFAAAVEKLEKAIAPLANIFG